MQQLASRSPQSPEWHQIGLLSLWDMLNFQADLFVTVNSAFERVGHIVEGVKGSGKWEETRHQRVGDKELATCLEVATATAQLCEVINCGITKIAVERLAKDLNSKTLTTFEHVSSAYSDITSRFQDELKQQQIFYITPERFKYWERDNLISDLAKTRFEHAGQEIRLAGTAYCCQLATACVFHSMRAAETGLRQVASELSVALVGDENMRNLVDGIQAKARALDNAPKSTTKSSDAQHYSEIALDAGLMKDAWRNYVAHAKINYTENQALDVLNATRRFLEKISSRAAPLQP